VRMNEIRHEATVGYETVKVLVLEQNQRIHHEDTKGTKFSVH
jgi:hypothetical protein